MKKIMLILLTITSLSAFAQKKEKIKGNREVLIKKFTIAPFTAIEVGEKFNIKLEKATDTTRVVVETDDNLFDVIHFKVEDKVLSFWTSMEIVKKKRLRITVYIPANFNKIKLLEKGHVFTDTQLELNKLNLESYYKSGAKLDLKIKENLELNALEKSDLDLEILAPKANVNLSDNANLKAIFNLKTAEIEVNHSASCELEGDIEQLNLKALEKSKVKADQSDIKNVNLLSSDKAKVYISVTKQIIMNLSGKTETYLFGTPEIKLKSFEDNAALYKK